MRTEVHRFVLAEVFGLFGVGLSALPPEIHEKLLGGIQETMAGVIKVGEAERIARSMLEMSAGCWSVRPKIADFIIALVALSVTYDAFLGQPQENQT